MLSPVFHQATLGRDIQLVFGKPLAQLVGRYQAESSFHLRSLRGLHSCQEFEQRAGQKGCIQLMCYLRVSFAGGSECECAARALEV